MASFSILGIVHKQLDRLIISKFLPIGILGYYSFAYNNVSKGLMVSQAISQASLPYLCDQLTNSTPSSLLRQYKKLQDLVCLINVPVFIAISFFIVPLLSFIFDAEVARTLKLPVVFLCLGFYMNGTLNIPYRFILTLGKPDIEVRRTFYSLFIIPPLTLLFIYTWGITGAALGWICYFLFAYLYTIPKFFQKCLAVSPITFFKHLLKIFILTGITYGNAWIILSILGSQTLTALIIAYLIGSIFFFIGAYFLMFEDLRKTINNYTRRLLSLVILRFTRLGHYRRSVK
jgi:O-antigen/teichoic acid export membrane protein